MASEPPPPERYERPAPPQAVPPPPPPGGPDSRGPSDGAQDAGPSPGPTPGVDGPLGGRLHPAAILVNGLGQLLPLVFLLVAGPFALPAVLGIGSLGFAVAAAQWWRFAWRLDAESLVIEQGLLQRKRRVIPLARIQSVESVRKLRHRILGVVALRVESVGGDETEGRLEALDPDQAAHVRRVLLRMAPASAPVAAGTQADVDAEDGEQLVRLSFGRLVAAGLTGGRVGVAAAILGFGQELWLDPVLQTFESEVLDRGVPVVAATVVVAALALFIISVLATALVFWDFTLVDRGDALGVRRGLLEQRSDTIPRRRIQAVRIEENVLRRALGLAAVKIEVAGRASPGNSGGQTDVVLPLGSRSEALALADRLLATDTAVAGSTLQPMPAAARRRRLVRAAVVGGLAFVPAVVDVRFLPAGVLVAAVAVVVALAAYRALGWHSRDDVMLAQSGVLVRRRWVVPATAVQSASTSTTPFQRRQQLATLQLEIARSGNAGDPTLPDLAAADADKLLQAAATRSTDAGRAQVAARRRRLAARQRADTTATQPAG